jgi:hypothetical protein
MGKREEILQMRLIKGYSVPNGHLLSLVCEERLMAQFNVCFIEDAENQK